MRCRDVRETLPAARLGLESEAVRAAVARHLASCPECAAEARAESDLAEMLASLASDPVPAVDSRARVLRAIEREAPAIREPVPLAEAAWASLAAIVAAIAILASGVRLAPSLWDALRGSAPAIVAVGAFMLKIGRSVTETFTILDVCVRAGHDVLTAAATLLAKTAPLARAAALLSAVLMLGVTTAIVCRDLGRRAVRSREE
jgi:predicted anti-sigma-YlaC factor YlaD